MSSRPRSCSRVTEQRVTVRMRRTRAEVQQKPALIGDCAANRFRAHTGRGGAKVSTVKPITRRFGQTLELMASLSGLGLAFGPEGTWAFCGLIGKGPGRIVPSWKKANATAFPQWRRPSGRTKKSACLRRVQFGAVQFVDGVAASGGDYVTVVEHGGGVAGARVAHAAGCAPCASRRVIEFGAGQRRGSA